MTTKVSPQLLDQSSGIGYTTGVGGTVTQSTDKTTPVELNKVCGRITLAASAIPAGSAVTFLFGNTLAGPDDVLAVSVKEYGGANENYVITTMTRNGGGGFFISIRNMSANPLSDAVPLNFAVIKGVTN